MIDEDRLADLLLEWEERHERGDDPPAAELCRDCPHLAGELAEMIAGLKATAWMGREDGGDDGPAPPPGPDAPPRLLAGRYRLEGKIAEGGSGEVWQGYDIELRRAVAVKLPRAGRPASAERFVAEARRVARLKHPGVVPVFDAGRDGDSCYIVSEYVEGGSLAERAAAGRLSHDEAARLVAEVAETLAYAHRQGFVHRDIKPANVLIDHHGRAVLADFGITRSPDDEGDGGPAAVGTLAYMSPEQVRGGVVDHRSDIYGLGVVLYELLTGRLPHPATDPVALRRAVASGAVPPLDGLPAKLAAVCRACLAPDPANRYPDAGALAADLRRAGSSSGSRRLSVAAIAAGIFFVAAAATAYGLNRPNDRPEVGQQDHLPVAATETATHRPPPASVEAALALGRLHFGDKEWDRAEAAFTDAIRLDPANAEAYHRRAGCRFNAGRVADSLPDFDAATRLAPTNPEVFKNRGIAYLSFLRFVEAIADLTHAIELDPDHPEAYRKVLGQAHARRAFEWDREKKWQEAVADMDAAIRFDPANADYFDKRGSFRYNLRQFDAAVSDFTEAIRLDPQPAYHLHRGYAHQAAGRRREAADDYERAETDPERRAAAWVLGVGGRVHVDGEAPANEVQSIRELPSGPFRVVTVNLWHNPHVRDGDLARLAPLARLTRLDLQGTAITDAGLNHLRGSTALAQLWLDGTKLTDAGLEHLTGLTRLFNLQLNGTGVSDSGVRHLLGLTGVKWLGLGDTRLTDDGLAALAGPLTGIKHLNLRGTRVTDTGLARLRRLPGLRKLYLENTAVTGAGFGTLADLGGVEELYLAGSRVGDGGIEPLARLPKLTWLDLSGTRVTGRGVADVAKITSLRQLYLNRRPLTDDDLAPLAGLTDLQSLHLSGTAITDAGLRRLEGLSKVEWLYLENTAVTDAGVPSLTKLTRLEHLSLRNTKVTDAGLDRLRGLARLNTLFVGGAGTTPGGIAAFRAARPGCTVGP
ncbi:MAG: protein kinase [Bacteroidales bacterium]|nr:protein kinase [Bacteroidales bacterium]